MHYLRWNRTGSTDDPVRLSNEDQYQSKAVKRPGCWGWTGATIGGYGVICDHGQTIYAHRISYQINIGAIPEGAEIDHACHNKICSNPDHLRPATRKQNAENRRGASRNSRTGVRGVRRIPSGRYVATVGHDGRTYYLGVHNTAQEAGAVASAKRNELFTHNATDRAS